VGDIRVIFPPKAIDSFFSCDNQVKPISLFKWAANTPKFHSSGNFPNVDYNEITGIPIEIRQVSPFTCSSFFFFFFF